MARERLVELLRTRQFQALDAAIADLQRGFDARKVPEWQVDLAYRAFQPYEWDIEAVLNEWVSRAPAAYQPYLARGLYYTQRGWLERGDSWDDGDAVGEQLTAMRIAYESAIRDLQHALRLYPRLASAWATLVSIAGALNDRGELQHNLRAGLAAVPDSMGIRWAYAYALYYRDARRELDAFVKEMQRSAPKDHPSYRGIATWLDNFEGYRLLREGEYHTAALVFERALQHDDRTRLRAGRAAAYLEMGNLDAAEADLRAALAQRPWEDDYLARLAGLLWEREKRDEVEALLDRAIALAPMYPSHRLLRAYVRFELNRADEALADLAVAEVYGRFDPRIHHLRGDILAERDPQAALRALAAARRLSPDASAIQLSYASVLHQSGDCRAADALVAYRRMCVEARDCSPRAPLLWASIETTPCHAGR
ncbi:MAG TPA: DUF4034 domain-containing protein [Alphaproteobacteria bacterium]|nr:DUF4034 domain-containing protein [Alphaproteobacteria bacterium]